MLSWANNEISRHLFAPEKCREVTQMSIPNCNTPIGCFKLGIHVKDTEAKRGETEVDIRGARKKN